MAEIETKVSQGDYQDAVMMFSGLPADVASQPAVQAREKEIGQLYRSAAIRHRIADELAGVRLPALRSMGLRPDADMRSVLALVDQFEDHVRFVAFNDAPELLAELRPDQLAAYRAFQKEIGDKQAELFPILRAQYASAAQNTNADLGVSVQTFGDANRGIAFTGPRFVDPQEAGSWLRGWRGNLLRLRFQEVTVGAPSEAGVRQRLRAINDRALGISMESEFVPVDKLP